MVKISPLLSIVIPAFNEEAEIKICLDSITKQDLGKKYYEVIVVDNASTDKTAKIIKKYPFKYIFEPKKSVVIARQTGADLAKGQIIVSADADTKYPKDWLSKIKEDFDNDKNLIGVAGWLYFRGTKSIYKTAAGISQEINLFISKHSQNFPLVFAANFAFKKSALKKIGGYPKHLPELGDQQYLLKKFSKLGKIILDPKIKAYTSGRQLKELSKNIFINNGWHRFVGYPINYIFDKEIIKARPAIRRKITPPQKSRSGK